MKSNSDPVIVSMGRSPIGVFGGSLSSLRAHQIAAQIMSVITSRVGIDLSIVDDVILGDCAQCSDEANTARTAMLAAKFPEDIPGVTIQRQCSSAMQALYQASIFIKAGEYSTVVVGGVESMSNAPYVIPKARWGVRLQHTKMIDSLWEMLHSGSNILHPKGQGYIMGVTAENLARKYNISREDQDIVALNSHNNAEKAIIEGRFEEEIIPIKKVSKRSKKIEFIKVDEHVRMGLKMEDLKKLKPVFDKEGTVTAGNSSGLNDGAAMCVVMSREQAKRNGLIPIARIYATSVAGCDPSIMGWGPVPATRKLLKKTGVEMSDIQLIELNEAFAAQYLACERALKLDRSITNVNGSGIGLGHPVGCTGTRIVISLINELRRQSKNLGLATLCVGGGMGMSMLVEVE